MRKLTWHTALLLTMTTLMASCADSSGEPRGDTVSPSDAAVTSGPPASAPTTSEPTAVAPTAPDAHEATSTGDDQRARIPGVAAAMTDLAERGGFDPGDVTITSLEQVTWRDGSIGCPQPGMQYSQALVEGQRLVLGLASDPAQSFAYHAGSRGVFRYCESPQPPVEGAPGST